MTRQTLRSSYICLTPISESLQIDSCVRTIRAHILTKAEINQGLPESDVGSTGQVGQDGETIEDLDNESGRVVNPKDQKRPSPAYSG